MGHMWKEGLGHMSQCVHRGRRGQPKGANSLPLPCEPWGVTHAAGQAAASLPTEPSHETYLFCSSGLRHGLTWLGWNSPCASGWPQTQSST